VCLAFNLKLAFGTESPQNTPPWPREVWVWDACAAYTGLTCDRQILPQLRTRHILS